MNYKKSAYDKNDYRSSLFSGEWIRYYIDDMAKKAVHTEEDLFDVFLKGELYQKEHLPMTLYKFFPFNQNSLKCIENGGVYLNAPSNFNDPFDCLIQTNPQEFQKRYFLEKIVEYDLLEKGVIDEDDYREIINSVCYDKKSKRCFCFKEEFSSALNHVEQRNDFPDILSKIKVEANEYLKKGLKELKKNEMRVTSFSNFDIWKWSAYTEMWGHYGDSHKGFCVEYDLTDFIDRFEKGESNREETAIMSCMFPCLYKSKPKYIAPLIFYKYARGNNLSKYQYINLQKDIMYSYLYKSSSWSYENEWRIVLPKNYSALWSHLIPFPYAKRIYLGVNMPTDDKEYMYKVGERLGLEIYDSYLDDYKYEINFMNINVKQYFAEREYQRKTKLDKLI